MSKFFHLLAFIVVAFGTSLPQPALHAADVQVFFSPRGGCTDAIVSNLDAANNNVRVLAYSFTSHKITQALIRAKARGVDVKVVLDKSNLSDRHSDMGTLLQAGVPVLVDSNFKIAHDKVMVIDNRLVITGSFNFSWSAEEENAENLLILSDSTLAAQYLQRWQELANISLPPQ